MATLENVTLSIPGAVSGTVTVSASAVIRFTDREVAAKARFQIRAVLVASGEDELVQLGKVFVPPVLYQFTWPFSVPSGPEWALSWLPITAQAVPFQLILVREVPVVTLNEDPGHMTLVNDKTIPPTVMLLPNQDEIICRVALSPTFSGASGVSEVARVRLGQ
jgi:hypothetical protein